MPRVWLPWLTELEGYVVVEIKGGQWIPGCTAIMDLITEGPKSHGMQVWFFRVDAKVPRDSDWAMVTLSYWQGWGSLCVPLFIQILFLLLK